jgi:hypothetical protein
MYPELELKLFAARRIARHPAETYISFIKYLAACLKALTLHFICRALVE